MADINEYKNEITINGVKYVKAGTEDKTSRFKKITGGTEEDAYKKFPWLKEAEFMNAEIDITHDFLIWKGGTWEAGFWKDGLWEGGKMWSNIRQKFEDVEQEGNIFKKIQG